MPYPFSFEYNLLHTKIDIKFKIFTTHVRSTVARVRVRAKSILESVRDVHACGPFLGVRCAITLLHTFWNKTDKKWHFFFVLKTVLERPFLF